MAVANSSYSVANGPWTLVCLNIPNNAHLVVINVYSYAFLITAMWVVVS